MRKLSNWGIRMRLLLILMALSLGSVASHAESVTIDFEEFNGQVALFESLPTSFETKGFSISEDGSDWFAEDPFDGGTSVLLGPTNNPGSITITKDGGQVFSLHSFDYSFGAATGSNSIYLSAITAGGGVINLSPTLATDYFMYTHDLDGAFYNIVSVTFSQEVGNTALTVLDNIVVSAVPIPAAVWLFGSALAGLGWMRRKQTV